MTFYYKTKEGYTLELNFRDYNDRIDIEQLHMFFGDQTHRCHYLKNTYIHDEDGFSVSICTVPLIDENGRKYITLEAMRNDEELISSGFISSSADFDFDQRIYLDEYKRFTMADILKLVENKTPIDNDMFILAAIHDGVHNIRFEMNFMRYDNFAASLGIGLCSSDDRIVSIGKIRDLFGTEQRRSYKLIDNYKIDIEPVERTLNGHMLAGRDYYISDFLSMCRSGIIKILPSVGDPSVNHSEEYFRERKLDWFNASYK